MKKLIIPFILITILFSCKKEDEKPVSKSAPLRIEFTGQDSGPIYSSIALNLLPSNVITDTSTSISYTFNESVQGNQTIVFSSIAYLPDGNRATYGTYDIAITYNGVQLCNKHFTNNTGVNCTVDLPFIE